MVFIRVDGSPQIGLGHLVRCIALAQMLKDEYAIHFVCRKVPDSIAEEIRSCGFELTRIEEEQSFLEMLTGKEIVVLDNYLFDTEYQSKVKESGCKLVCIDDLHSIHFISDAVINHAGGVTVDVYSLEPYTKCYLGPQYALLRPPFLKNNEHKPIERPIRNIFINMGGADPLNETCRVLRDVSACEMFEEIYVVTGAAFNYREDLEYLVKLDQRILHYSSLGAAEMAVQMEKCGMAVCPPSSVSFEYASIGGLLFLKQIADNQSDVKKYFIEKQLAFDFDIDFLRVINADPKNELIKLIDNQSKILDGKSPERIKAIFYKLSLALGLSFRRVEEYDLMICYQWANDLEVRNSSYNSNPIVFEDHINWFKKKLADPATNFYIVEYESRPVGQIRFDGNGEKIISYLIASEMRGKGLGSLILEKGVETLLKDSADIKKISGYVKRDNVASCKAFEKAGFIKDLSSEVPYADSVKYELNVQQQLS